MNLLLKLHAWFYRRTGVMTKYSKKQEQKYIDSLDIKSDLERHLLTGCWQAKHGFLRPMVVSKRDWDKIAKEAYKDRIK